MAKNKNSRLKKCLYLRDMLRKCLGEKYPEYKSSVREWIRKKKTRAELDVEVSYLHQPARKVHSEFLLALSKLCCGRLSLHLDPIRMQPIVSPWDPADLHDDSPCGRLVVGACSGAAGDDQQDPFVLYKKVYMDRDLYSVELIKARFYLTAWEQGLTTFDTKVGHLLYLAMQNYIKDIIQAAVPHRGSKDRISSLDIWHTVTRTNCDLPAIPYTAGVCHFTLYCAGVCHNPLCENVVL